MLASKTSPAGHGFGPDRAPWYSVLPLPGLRLIGLFTADQIDPGPGEPCWEGSISPEQLEWFKAELDASTARGELIIVATHHPSASLETLYGGAADPESFRSLLSAHPAVILHLAGHKHRNRVAQRGGYLEIETCSTMDWPQEARLIEIWRDADGAILIGYENFNHLEEALPPLGDDPLFELRREAYELAKADAEAHTARGLDNTGSESDRRGLVRIR
jgi:3',5'-cyclic AMP phosphodiesterase CpdA